MNSTTAQRRTERSVRPPTRKGDTRDDQAPSLSQIGLYGQIGAILTRSLAERATTRRLTGGGGGPVGTARGQACALAGENKGVITLPNALCRHQQAHALRCCPTAPWGSGGRGTETRNLGRRAPGDPPLSDQHQFRDPGGVPSGGLDRLTPQTISCRGRDMDTLRYVGGLSIRPFAVWRFQNREKPVRKDRRGVTPTDRLILALLAVWLTVTAMSLAGGLMPI